jgi:hypothetical protein
VETLPLGQGSEWIVPAATTGSTVAATSEGGNVTFTNWVTAVKTLDVKTLAGGVTLSQQFADLAPAFANAAIATDLAGKYGQTFEQYALTSSDTNCKGLQQTASIGTVVTVGSDLSVLWRAILGAVTKIADTGSYSSPDCIVMHPLLLSNIVANQGKTPAAGTAIDGRPQGVKFPAGNAVNAYMEWNGSMLGDVGSIFGIPVIATPANTVENTTEYRVYVLNRGLGHRVFATQMRTRLASQVGIGTLTPEVVVFGYVAQYSPHPAAIVQVNGTATAAAALVA